MIDPKNITKFDNSTEELEETILWWILAAGKNAITASRCLEKFLVEIHDLFETKERKPFCCLRKLEKDQICNYLKKNGVGCYTNKSRSFFEISRSYLDLKKCTAFELEKIYGIGMKTSRCFIIHSRKNAKYAGLDVHLLRYLKDQGYDVPSQTPNKKNYLKLEKIFLDIVEKAKMTVADFDLMIWKQYSGRN